MSKVSVVLIDDNPDDNFLNERVIKMSGQGDVVEVFRDGESALAWFSAEPRSANLILLDINMPGMNGFEFLEAYHELPEENRQGVVIVMLTSFNFGVDIDKAKAFGSGIMSKPLTIEKFKEVVEEYLSNKT